MVVKVGYNVFEVAKHRSHLINRISIIIITISVYDNGFHAKSTSAMPLGKMYVIHQRYPL